MLTRFFRLPTASHTLLVFALTGIALNVNAQTPVAPPVAAAAAPVVLTVKVQQNARPVVAATVRSRNVQALSDSLGIAHLGLPPGRQTVLVSRKGMQPETLSVVLQLRDTTITVALNPEGTTLAPVVITSTRANRRLQEETERIEILTGEDVGEKSVMKPGNSTSLLSELPGVRMQVTSPALGSAGLRIQGLRARYTLLLTDGLPLYGRSSEGLGFLQIPALDLAQAEVIKGSATALYGPTAAAGVLNLISRRPPTNGVRDREVLLNQTTRRGTDGLLWSADRLSEKSGYTFLGGVHYQAASDVDGDRWIDIPAFRRVELRPRFFWNDKRGKSAMITVGATDERRYAGGAEGAGGSRRESANTRRGDFGVVAHMVDKMGDVFALRASANRQSQDRQFGDQTESDIRQGVFAEATLSRAAGTRGQYQTVAGIDVQTEALSSALLPNATYSFVATSAFGQVTYVAADRLSFSVTTRADHHNRYGTFVSPRGSALLHLSPNYAVRVSAGTGMFAPTPLLEATDAVGLSNVRGFASLRAERPTSVSLDVTRTVGALEMNGTLFRSSIARAVVVQETRLATPAALQLTNAPSPTRTSGAEFFAAYNKEPIAFTALYSYTMSSEWSPDQSRRVSAPLLPRHAAGLDIAFEEDESGVRVGLEVFYTGRQPLIDDPYRSVSVPFTTLGVLAEKRWGVVTLFVNAENLSNVRQTHFSPLLLPARGATGRWTTEQWAPLDGRTVNAGVRIRF